MVAAVKAGVPEAARKAGTLGTFAGVFTPSVLTILGIILFLRLGYVVGESGLQSALLIILLANAISVLTSFSVAAIATNLKVKGGGDYYLISRTLGAGFGGAIGIVLFLAQSISVGFYTIGFGEAAAALTGSNAPHLVQMIAGGAVLALFALAWLGADWASRFQYVVMALIVAALASFVIGAVGDFAPGLVVENRERPLDALPFWAAFAIFFPAVTGFTQGISMSGDLSNPGRSIPRGTFAAVGISVVVYVGVAVLLAGSRPLGSLSVDNNAMNRIAAFAPLIDAGVIAATLSSALASFLGAPRILQALAADEVFPALKAFAKGAGPANNPRLGVLLSGAIALGVVALGDLNLIASIVAMFFLVSYGLLNYATFYEAQANSPSFRPTFRYYDRRLSLIGGLGCLGAMLAIDIASGLAAAAVVFAIFHYLSRKGRPVRWSDSQRSHHLREVREHLLAAAGEPPHPRDWRPHILLFSADAQRRARSLTFARWIEGESGLATVVEVIEGAGPAALKEREAALERLRGELAETEATAFPLVVTVPDLDAGVATIVQSAGIGPLQANTVLANWIEGAPVLPGGAGAGVAGAGRTLQGEGEVASGRFGRNLRTAFRLGCNLVVLDADAEEWAALSDLPPEDRHIDVWWRENKTGELMLLLAYLMTRHDDWSQASIRVLAVPRDGESGEDRLETLEAFLEEVRIDAEAVTVEADDVEAMIAASRDTPVVFMPVGIHGGRFYGLFGGDVGDTLPRLQIVAMAVAAQDVDLEADPDTVEEGPGEAVAAAGANAGAPEDGVSETPPGEDESEAGEASRT